MNIKTALDKRIPRIRQTMWGNPNCYLRLPLLENGTHGVWVELYDEVSQNILGIPVGSQRIAIWSISDSEFEIYNGVISEHEQDTSNFANTYLEA